MFRKADRDKDTPFVSIMVVTIGRPSLKKLLGELSLYTSGKAVFCSIKDREELKRTLAALLPKD